MEGAKQVITINLDETSICSYTAGPGYRVRQRSAATEGTQPELSSHTSLQRRRAYMSHIALVCDSPEHQHMLPQILLVTKKLLTVADAAEVKRRCPPNVFLRHDASAWSNADLMVEVIVLLAMFLAGAGFHRTRTLL